MTDSCRRIAIVEDDPGIRDHFSDIIAAMPDACLVASAASLAEAAAWGLTNIDLALVDLGLPDGNGLSLVPRLKAHGDCRVLIITSFGDRHTVVSAFEAGADGYLLKDSSFDAVEEGIRITLDGGAPISAAAAVYLLERLRGDAQHSSTPKAETGRHVREDAWIEDDRLTAREAELLQCFAIGQSYKEAARSLGISPHTVGNHVKSVYRKLAVHSRSEAIYEAVRSGQLQL